MERHGSVRRYKRFSAKGRTASTLSVLSALLLCTAVFAQNSVSVEGTVVDSRTGLGIPDATEEPPVPDMFRASPTGTWLC